MAECTKFKEHYITLDSRDRNRTLWPNANQFQLSLTSNVSYDDAPEDNQYTAIRRVEVIEVLYPNKNHVVREPYLYLILPEIGGSLDASEVIGADAMAKLTPTLLIGDHVHVHFQPECRPTKTFDFDGLDLTTLTVEFRRRDGTLFSFGTDTSPPTDPDPVLQTSIVLRLYTQW